MKVNEYLVERLIEAETKLKARELSIKSLQSEIERCDEQLEAAHQFENNVLKFAKFLKLGTSSIDGDPYVSIDYLWKSHNPELFKFVRENLLYDRKDDGSLIDELKPQEDEDAPF